MILNNELDTAVENLGSNNNMDISRFINGESHKADFVTKVGATVVILISIWIGISCRG